MKKNCSFSSSLIVCHKLIIVEMEEDEDGDGDSSSLVSDELEVLVLVSSSSSFFFLPEAIGENFFQVSLKLNR